MGHGKEYLLNIVLRNRMFFWSRHWNSFQLRLCHSLVRHKKISRFIWSGLTRLQGLGAFASHSCANSNSIRQSEGSWRGLTQLLYRCCIYFLFLVAIALITSCNHSNENHEVANIKLDYKAPEDWPKSFGIGEPATDSQIALVDIDVRPDGKGLPPGFGDAVKGRNVYALKCASCHGQTGIEGPFSRLVAPMGDTTKAKAIGNYWPYSTTLFDYIRRAMPYNAPGSLSGDEVYSITAFLLSANKIMDSTKVINAANLSKVKMPAHQFFVNDDRRGGAEVR
jgi:mono/diheme cytochrome c family protein